MVPEHLSFSSPYCCECLKFSKVKWFWKWEIKFSLFVLKQNFTIEKCHDLPFFCSRFSSSWEQLLGLCTQGIFCPWQFTLQHSSQMCYSVLLSLLLYFCLLLVFTSLPIHQLDLPLSDLIWGFVLGIGSPCTKMDRTKPIQRDYQVSWWPPILLPWLIEFQCRTTTEIFTTNSFFVLMCKS